MYSQFSDFPAEWGEPPPVGQQRIDWLNKHDPLVAPGTRQRAACPACGTEHSESVQSCQAQAAVVSKYMLPARCDALDYTGQLADRLGYLDQLDAKRHGDDGPCWCGCR